MCLEETEIYKSASIYKLQKSIEIRGETMQDFLLLLAVAAIFVFGYFVIKKWDCFLECNRKTEGLLLTADRNSLKIGFSNPLVADCLSDVLEKYLKMKPEISVFLFSGTEDELNREFSDHRLDVVFLPVSAAVPEKMRDNIREVLLSHTPVIMKYGGLPIEPITKGCISYHVLLPELKDEPAISFFVECLVNAVGMDCKSGSIRRNMVL